jgi:tetratricopeptide (TPR) repeat protein
MKELEKPGKRLRHMPGQTQFDPENAWARYLHGRALNSEERYDQAARELNESIRLEPCRPDSFYEAAISLLNQGDLRGAGAMIDKAIEMDPVPVQYRTLRQQIQEQNEPEKWDPVLQQRTLREDPANATAWLNLGIISYHNQEYEEALRYLGQAVTIDPLVSEGWYYQGMALYELGRYEEAVCSFDQVLLVDPGNAWAYYYRGDILQKSGRCDYAAPYLAKAIQLDASIPWTYYLKGVCDLNQTRYQQAADDFDRSLERNPCNQWAWFFGGQSYYQLYNYDTASTYFTHALAADPTNPEFRRWKAAAFAESGYPDEAIYLYNLSVPRITPGTCTNACPSCG